MAFDFLWGEDRKGKFEVHRCASVGVKSWGKTASEFSAEVLYFVISDNVCYPTIM